MLNTLILVFVGGAVGAMLREFLMLIVRDPVDGFPLDILTANLVAAFLLGLVTAQHARKAVSDNVNTLVGTGIMGGLSTFSSFVYGSFVLLSGPTHHPGVAMLYIVVSLVLGYIAVIVGMRLGSTHKRRSA